MPFLFTRWFYSLSLLFRSLFRRGSSEHQLNEEIQHHLNCQIQENLAKGLAPDEARYAALRTFGGVEQRKEECRDRRHVNLIDNLLRDIRYALRGFVKNPAFTCAAILTLSLGIGANTAVFTMVNSILLKQLPLKNADGLIWIWSTRTDRDKAFYSIPNFVDTRDRSQTLAEMAAFANWGANLTGSGDAERLGGVRISANAFQMLGVQPAVGRILLPADGAPDAGRVVVLSNGLWQRRFGADARIVGQAILLNGIAYTVVGVLPAQFVLPNADVEVASPLVFETDSQRSDRGSNFLRTFARLKAGVTAAQAQAELAAITERLRQQYPIDNGKHTAPRVIPLRDEVVGSYRALLWTLLSAVGMVLLIACTNLAHMLLARSSARRKEIALRTALGGTRARITSELMVASSVLAGIGGTLGVFLASWGVRLLVALSPATLPRIGEISLDWRVLAFTVSCCIAVGVVFGIIPAMQASRVDVNEVLKAAGGTSTHRLRGIRIRSGLVVAEVGLSLVLLITAGLLVRSFMNLESVEAGVDPRNLLSVRLSLPATRYSQPDSFAAFLNRLLNAVRNEPGVRSVSIGSVLPLSGMNTRADFSVAGHAPLTEAEKPAAQNRWVAPGYFATMSIPIVRGRDFGELDTARSQLVAVIDETLAQRQFPGEDPIGRHLLVGDAGPEVRDVEVVGIAGNVKHFSLDDPPTMTYYCPIAQVARPALGFLINGMSLVVRTERHPLSKADAVHRQIQALDHDIAASSVQTMDQLLASSIAPRKFNLILIEIFALSALVLSALGIYAVIAYAVNQRRREIGICMALGAAARTVFTEIVREGMVLTFSGIACGLIAALFVTRLISGMLYGVSATDPLTFVVISLVLILTALAACYVPARRATRVAPVIALRPE